MLARIINNGYRRVYPTCIGDLRIPKGQEYTLDHPKAIRELSEYPDLTIEVMRADAADRATAADYSKYPINQLRNIASNAGKKDSFFMKKVDLIKFLEEKNEPTI
jgi:hypothetical protein